MTWAEREPVLRVRRRLRAMGEQRAVVARAPGRLDVMGGIADYMGSRVCQLPVAVSAACGVARRTDGRVVCVSAQAAAAVEIDVKELWASEPAQVRELFQGDDAWARYPVGCLWWLIARTHVGDGVTIVLDSDVPAGAGVSSSAAIEVATMTALCGLIGHTMEPIELACACQVVENRVVGAPCGVMDQIASCMGKQGALVDILCQPVLDGPAAQVLGYLAPPEGVTFVGIDSGVRHDVSGEPYTATRVAAFIADRFIRDLGFDSEGMLARVPLGRYEAEFRQRIPRIVNGWGFVARFQKTRDTVTAINRGRDYHVRDAADHHVRDSHRVVRFIKALQEGDVTKAGELMNASHASYRDCAHLGHPMTDRLFELVMSEMEHGLLGCRSTGGGCGGTVAVMMRDTPEAFAAIERVRERYANDTGLNTLLFAGPSDGAATTGCREVTL